MGGQGTPMRGLHIQLFFDHSSSPGHLTNPRKFGRDWFIIGRDIAHFVLWGHNMGGGVVTDPRGGYIYQMIFRSFIIA